MNLTTLEQSKELKEWGVPQDTNFIYLKLDENNWFKQPQYLTIPRNSGGFREFIAAYDLESLIGWLQSKYPDHDMYNIQLSQVWNKNEWEAHVETAELTCEGCGYGETPLDAVMALCEAIHSPSKEIK